MMDVVVSQLPDVVLTVDPTATTLVVVDEQTSIVTVPSQGPPGTPGPAGPPPTAAQILAAVQSLLGAANGLATLDSKGRQPLAQDQIRAWQVRRAAKEIVVTAGGTWSAFESIYIIQDPDDQGGSAEAYEAGAPAPLGGVLANLLQTYFVTQLGQSAGQAAAALAAIWAAAAAVTP